MVKRGEKYFEQLVSVIVPIYNVEQYLRECVDSILNNTFRNLEVILVDDGSPDHCGMICDEYGNRDSRVKVIHQDNKGLVGARNTGLAIASGQYISFVDSDDILSPVFYEVMVKTLELHHADMICCNAAARVDELDCSVDLSCSFNEAYFYDDMMAIITSAPSVRDYSWTGCNVWNKLYRRDHIIKLFNPKCLMCEDLQFNADYIENCKKILTIQNALYYYRPNENGIMGNYRNSTQKISHGICHAQCWASLAAQKYQDDELQHYLHARSVYMAHGALWRVYTTHQQEEYAQYITDVRTLTKRWFKDFWNETHSYNLKIRVVILAMRFAFPVWKSIAYLAGKVR